MYHEHVAEMHKQSLAHWVIERNAARPATSANAAGMMSIIACVS